MKKETTLPDELARLLLLETDEDVKTEDDSPRLDYRRDIRSILTALYERRPTSMPSSRPRRRRSSASR